MPAPDTKLVVALASEIEAVKAHLAELEGKWESLFTSGATSTTVVSAPQDIAPVPIPSKRGPNANSVTGKIIAFLNSDPACHYEASEIASHIGEPQDKVQRMINKLVFQKKIGRYSRGMYESIIEV